MQPRTEIEIEDSACERGNGWRSAYDVARDDMASIYLRAFLAAAFGSDAFKAQRIAEASVSRTRRAIKSDAMYSRYAAPDAPLIVSCCISARSDAISSSAPSFDTSAVSMLVWYRASSPAATTCDPVMIVQAENPATVVRMVVCGSRIGWVDMSGYPLFGDALTAECFGPKHMPYLQFVNFGYRLTIRPHVDSVASF
jgi:hypothetical protein